MTWAPTSFLRGIAACAVFHGYGVRVGRTRVVFATQGPNTNALSDAKELLFCQVDVGNEARAKIGSLVTLVPKPSSQPRPVLRMPAPVVPRSRVCSGTTS
jgi:hypothetical protein